MKNVFLFAIIFVFQICFAFGQGSKGSGQKPEATPSSAEQPSDKSAAGSSNEASGSPGNGKTGFVYRLKWHYHIKYSSVSTSTTNTLRYGAVDTCKTINRVEVYKDTTYVNPFPAGGLNEVIVTSSGGEPTEQRSIKVPYGIPVYQRKQYPATFDTTTIESCKATPAFTTTKISIDSLPRYWKKPRGIFTAHRLKVALAQGQNGKIQVTIFTNDVETDCKHLDSADYLDMKTVTSLNKRQAIDTQVAAPLSQCDTANNFYLQIKNKRTLGDQTFFLSLPYAITQYGGVTIPFRYRRAPNTISKTASGTAFPTSSESSAGINIAAYVGRKWGRTRFYVDQSRTVNTVSFMMSAFAGATLISLNGNNVDSSIDLTKKASSMLAISFGPSATVEWRSISFGLFGGWDLPLQHQTGWVFRKKFWTGFGIGVNLGMFTSGSSQ